MATFFAIFLVLILVNAALLLLSSKRGPQSVRKLRKNFPDRSTIKIYPLDMISSDYKKAI